ncbi:hypothetical protein EFB08_02220 [Rufibacter latericius]|uniref:Uncharacterized protein n=1 Tax=Rufibacter latericius TaxID=2487040 RepID=A0A3M9N2I3_9BACT|nr:hypothetical protein EFB08_02220 [Rufibacter latericius]
MTGVSKCGRCKYKGYSGFVPDGPVQKNKFSDQLKARRYPKISSKAFAPNLRVRFLPRFLKSGQKQKKPDHAPGFFD